MSQGATPAGHDGPIVFFDGTCGLCFASVRWCIRHDRGGRLRYAPLRGSTAAEMLGPISEDSIVVSRPGWPRERVLIRSDAILEILRAIGGVWGLVGVLGRAVPRGVRDGLYRFVARRRKRWVREACAMTGDARLFLP